MNSVNIKSIRKAFEASSDGWLEWEGDRNKALASKKLCELLNIDKHTGDQSDSLKKLRENWWKKYFEDNELNEDFFSRDAIRKKSIESRYRSKDGAKQGYARINKIVAKRSWGKDR